MWLKSSGAVLTVEGHRRIKSFQTLETRNRKRIQAIYEQLATGYTELYGEEQKKKHEIVLRETNIEPSDICLDLGCGTGELLTIISRKSSFTVGVDLALNMLLETKRRVGRCPKCAVIWADAGYLPLRRHSLQTVFAVTVVLDPKSVSQAIDEVKRTLSIEGLAVFSIVRKAKEFTNIESVVERDLYGWEVRKMQVGSDVGWFAKKSGASRLIASSFQESRSIARDAVQSRDVD